MSDTITKEELLQLCKDYDAHHGEYPEDKLQGLEVYMWIAEKLGIIEDRWDMSFKNEWSKEVTGFEY